MQTKSVLEESVERICEIRQNACIEFLKAADAIREEREKAAASLGIGYVVVKAEDYMKLPGKDKNYLITDGHYLSDMGYDVAPLMKVLVFKRDEFDDILKYVRQFISKTI